MWINVNAQGSVAALVALIYDDLEGTAVKINFIFMQQFSRKPNKTNSSISAAHIAVQNKQNCLPYFSVASSGVRRRPCRKIVAIFIKLPLCLNKKYAADSLVIDFAFGTDSISSNLMNQNKNSWKHLKRTRMNSHGSWMLVYLLPAHLRFTCKPSQLRMSLVKCRERGKNRCFGTFQQANWHTWLSVTTTSSKRINVDELLW